RLEAFRLFAGRKRDHRRADAALVQAGDQRRKMRSGDIGVCHDGRPDAGQPSRYLLAGARDEAGSDQDVVGAIAEPDDDGFDAHDAVSPKVCGLCVWLSRCRPIASITSPAMTSLRSSRVAMVTSACA